MSVYTENPIRSLVGSGHWLGQALFAVFAIAEKENEKVAGIVLGKVPFGKCYRSLRYVQRISVEISSPQSLLHEPNPFHQRNRHPP